MSRKRFTERQVIETLFHQGVTVWCFRCLRPITPHRANDGKITVDAQREHLHEVALGGPDIPENCRYSHIDCHKVVTDGTKATTAGSSKHRIAKANNKNRTEKFVVNKPPIGGDETLAPLWRTTTPCADEAGPKAESAIGSCEGANAKGPAKPKRKWPSRPFQKPMAA